MSKKGTIDGLGMTSMRFKFKIFSMDTHYTNIDAHVRIAIKSRKPIVAILLIIR